MTKETQKDTVENDLFKELQPEGFLADWTNTIRRDVQGINSEWALRTGESLLSACAYGQYTGTQIGKICLGLWNLGIGVSGEYKTVPIQYFIDPTVQLLENKLKRVAPFSMSRFSPEGLIRHLGWHEQKRYDKEKNEYVKAMVIGNLGLFVKDEFTTMIVGVKNKGWMTGVSEVLSEVYDGKLHPRTTNKYGLQEVDYCNYALISATTPYLYDLLADFWFIQGLGNRVDYCMLTPSSIIKRKTSRFFDRGNNAQRKEDIERFTDQLLGLMNSKLDYVGIMPDAQELWINYEADIQQRKIRLAKEDIIGRGYLIRQPEKAIRRGAICCLSRNIKIIGKGALNIMVNEEDMTVAIHNQKRLYENFLKFIDAWRKYIPKSHLPPQDADMKRKVIAHMKTLKIASQGLIANVTGNNVYGRKFVNCLSSLIVEEILRMIPEEETVALIHKMTPEEATRQLIKLKPRGNPPSFYEYLGD